MRRICESVPVSRVILRFLRISQEISQVDSTCENSVLKHIYPSHCIRVLKSVVLLLACLVLFSRIISKFFVLTIDNIHHGQTKSQHYIAGWSSEKVSRRGVVSIQGLWPFPRSLSHNVVERNVAGVSRKQKKAHRPQYYI